jgi:hypothetical protein
MTSTVRHFDVVVRELPPTRRLLKGGRLLFAFFVSFLVIACATPTSRPQRAQMFNTSALTTGLQRGISTVTDVRRILGEPQGSGGFLFPMEIGEGPVWYYESVKIDTSSGKIDVQQDVVLVFFKGDRFEGFLWFSDASKR